MANRTQALALGFLLLMWAGLVAILALAPEVYDRAFRLTEADRFPGELAFLTAISALVALLAIGALRRWRWTFWLIMVAFLFGVLRVPVSILELGGVLPAARPTWYTLFQALIGLVQLVIGLLMLLGYRRAGVWGRF